MIDIEKLTALAIAYDAGDAKRIQHFIKVYAYSRLLGRREGLDEQKQNVLEAAAVLHDIGIHEAERKQRLERRTLAGDGRSDGRGSHAAAVRRG